MPGAFQTVERCAFVPRDGRLFWQCGVSTAAVCCFLLRNGWFPALTLASLGSRSVPTSESVNRLLHVVLIKLMIAAMLDASLFRLQLFLSSAAAFESPAGLQLAPTVHVRARWDLAEQLLDAINDADIDIVAWRAMPQSRRWKRLAAPVRRPWIAKMSPLQALWSKRTPMGTKGLISTAQPCVWLAGKTFQL